jgi:hypothetical protein
MHLKLLVALALMLFASGALARTLRSSAQRSAFVHATHCPSTGRARGPCPGYVVDHIVPLCAGGADRPRNMQWQTIAAARAKDVEERALCRRRKVARPQPLSSHAGK